MEELSASALQVIDYYAHSLVERVHGRMGIPRGEWVVRSDDSPSLKGRGFYGLAPTLCRPTATTLASLNTAEVACAATA